MDTWAIQAAAAHTALTSGIRIGDGPAAGSGSLGGFVLGLSLAGMAIAAANPPWRLRSPRRSAGIRRGSGQYGPQHRAMWLGRMWSNSGRWARTRPRRHVPVAAGMGGSALAEPGPAASPGQDRRFEPTEQSRPYADIGPRVDIDRLADILARADEVLGGAPAAPPALAAATDADESTRHRLPEDAWPPGPDVHVKFAEFGDDEADAEPLAPSFCCPDEDFWDPAGGEPAGQAPSGGYRSKHRLAGPQERPMDDDSEHSSGHKRSAPRHAAPSPGMTAKLSSAKPPSLTSHSSHAAW
ncbi:MAG TPA: hypothetical protein VMR14_04375 [Streptosporangiaceae bacterium]|nr:hypothetical protein [Streptosporangiaceae bacterium]